MVHARMYLSLSLSLSPCMLSALVRLFLFLLPKHFPCVCPVPVCVKNNTALLHLIFSGSKCTCVQGSGLWVRRLLLSPIELPPPPYLSHYRLSHVPMVVLTSHQHHRHHSLYLEFPPRCPWVLFCCLCRVMVPVLGCCLCLNSHSETIFPSNRFFSLPFQSRRSEGVLGCGCGCGLQGDGDGMK